MFERDTLTYFARVVAAVVIFLVAVWVLAVAPLREAAAIDPQAVARQLAGFSSDSTVAAINASLSAVAADLRHDQLVAQARLGIGMSLLGLALLVRPVRAGSPPQP